MKQNNIYAISYFQQLLNNGWIEPKVILEELQRIDADIKKTKDIHKQKLLKAQKMVLEEVLR